MIDQLIYRVFADRNRAHLEHWAATGPGSYARHVALGDFYDSIIDGIDKIVETYQGAFDLVAASDTMIQPVKPTDFLDALEQSAEWIEINREKISKRNSAIGNLVDSLLENYYTAIYKLRNLQ